MTSSVAPGLFAFEEPVANEANATKREPEDDEDGVHRLRDIVVEEVSLVDRAANKRRFLVVKRSDDMADDGKLEAEMKPERQGGAAETRVEKAKKKPKVMPDAETEKARRRAAATDDAEAETEKASRKDEDETEKARSRRSDGEEEDAKKAQGDEEDDDEEDEDDEDADEMEKARSKKKPTVGGRPEANEEVADSVTEKADADDELILPKPVKDAVLRVLAQALERLMAVANRVKEASEPDDDSKAAIPDDVGRELADLGELLEDVGERLSSPASKAGVKKAGARMAKDRLDRFQKALALLSEVLKELTNAKKPTDPTAGAAEDKVEKRDRAPGMGDLVASIGELTRVVKRQEEELTRIRKTRGVSNAITVDGGGRRAEPQDVSWPLDMNRPISRDSVAKAVSFYEE